MTYEIYDYEIWKYDQFAWQYYAIASVDGEERINNKYWICGFCGYVKYE